MNSPVDISHKNVLESMPFGIIQVDLSGIVIYANKSAFSMLGISDKSQLQGIHYQSFHLTQFDKEYNPIDSENHALYQVLNYEKVVTSKVHGAKIDGTNKWFSINAAPIYDDENKLIGGVSNFADITKEVEEDRARRQEEDRYKILVENINAVVWESTMGSVSFTYISPKVTELFGYDRTAWLQDGFWQSILHEEDKERVLSYEKLKTRDVDDYQLEYRLIHNNGKVIWVRDMVEVVKVNGKPERLRGLMLDVTEQKQSRIQLRESEKRYRQMISEAPYGISIYDRKGTLIATNQKSAEFWNIDLDDYIGTFNLLEDNILNVPPYSRRIAEAFNGIVGETTAKIPLPEGDGLLKWFRIKYYPLHDSKGDLDNVVFISEDITEYIESKEKTEREEFLKQGILDALNEALLVVDENGIIININKSLSAYINTQPYNELKIGESVFDFMEYFGEVDYLKEGLKAVLNQEMRALDHEMKLADDKWYNLKVTPLNEPFGAVIAWQNINTRKEIEIALEKSLKKYRNIYNKAPVMMHSINDKQEIISVSDFWLEKMGYERNEVIGKSPVDFLVKDSKGKIAKNMRQLFKEGFVRNAEYGYKKKSGQVMDVLLSAVAEYDEDGNFERSITGMLDVSDLKIAERKLQESQFKLLESQRISKMANYEYNIASGDFIPSEEMVSMMGFSKGQLNISIVHKLIHPEDIQEFTTKLEKSIKESKDFFHIYRIKHLKTKKNKWISGRGTIIKERGSVVKMIGTVQDITEQKTAEQKIKRLTDRILLATEIANLGVWEYDRESDEIFWEDQMYSIFSDCKEPIPLTELKKYFINEDEKVLNDSLRVIRKGINFLESEMKIKVGDEIKYLRAFTRVLRNHNDKLRGMVGVIYDITPDKKLQVDLESSLEEKNVLIKEVHHRVKNNMQLISSILALKSYDLDDDKSKGIFEEVNDRIKAMSVIHDKLYTFYNVSEINIGEYLNNIASELQILHGASGVSIEVKSAQVIMDVEKALLIGLMVSEMVSNAVKHSFKKEQNGRIRIHLVKLGEENILKVLNDGSRIEKDVLNSNTGLGISLIRTFVKQLNGKVEPDNENGFRVYF
ncbi:PAS domain S-box protein [Ekhidna sp.]